MENIDKNFRNVAEYIEACKEVSKRNETKYETIIWNGGQFVIKPFGNPTGFFASSLWTISMSSEEPLTFKVWGKASPNDEDFPTKEFTSTTGSYVLTSEQVHEMDSDVPRFYNCGTIGFDFSTLTTVPVNIYLSDTGFGSMITDPSVPVQMTLTCPTLFNNSTFTVRQLGDPLDLDFDSRYYKMRTIYQAIRLYGYVHHRTEESGLPFIGCNVMQFNSNWNTLDSFENPCDVTLIGNIKDTTPLTNLSIDTYAMCYFAPVASTFTLKRPMVMLVIPKGYNNISATEFGALLDGVRFEGSYPSSIVIIQDDVDTLSEDYSTELTNRGIASTSVTILGPTLQSQLDQLYPNISNIMTNMYSWMESGISID